MNERTLRQELVEAITKDPKAWSRILNLDTGVGTYDDVNELAAVIGDYIVKAVSSPEELAEYLREGHGLISIFSEVAQQNLNDATGIGLRPMVTKPPNARIATVVEELAAVDTENVKDALENVVVPELRSMVDSIIKYNADFQRSAGMHPVIKRTWSGSYPSHDTKHTDWCKDLAGTYDYDSRMDPRVFARHKGCRCKVEYFPDRSAEGRITALAKGEVDRNSVLWNTRSDTLEKRLKRANKN